VVTVKACLASHADKEYTDQVFVALFHCLYIYAHELCMFVYMQHGRTALHRASTNGYLEAAILLIDAGATLNCRNKVDLFNIIIYIMCTRFNVLMLVMVVQPYSMGKLRFGRQALKAIQTLLSDY